MSRNATLSLDDLDPDVLDAARDVARRAGVSLETWIESIVAPDAQGRGPEASPLPPQAPSTTSAVAERRRRKRDASDAGATHRAREQAVEATPVALPHLALQGHPEGSIAAGQDWSQTLGTSIGDMMRRLDALDRSMAESRKTSEDTAARAIETIEGRLASALDTGQPSGEMVERLADIERRMTELHAQLSGPRPLGRRGRPLVSEVRDAVEKVRERQRELDAGGAAAMPAQAAAPAPTEPSPAITELQRETSRLRDSLGSLATGQDVGALERAMHTLVTDVQRAQEPSDLAAIAAPIELIRVQVGQLAEEVAANVHARVSGEVERLATKVEGALRTQPANFADRDALDSVFRELEDIRRLVGALAGPERIQGLAQGLQSISGQIAQLQSGTGQSRGVDELKPLLEEIRQGLSAPDSSSKAILGRIDALADKMDRASVNPVGDLIGRLESLGEDLRRPAADGGDFATIQKMLRGLADKVDHVGASGGGGENLDALEKQVVAIAHRLDARGTDLAVAGLERMMGDLLKQVSSLRDDNSVEAAVERATRRAVAEAVTAPKGAAGNGGVDLLRADLADLCARQAVADERIQSTMGNLSLTLERLVERLGPSGTMTADPLLAAPPADETRTVADRLMSSAMPAPPKVAPAAAPAAGTPMQGRPVLRPEATQAPRFSDELLEPGAGRPMHGRAAMPEAAPSPPTGDIKANFIAAARRAAQAAQADIDTPIEPNGRAERTRSRVTGATAPATASMGGLVVRLRGEVDRHRRPLLLGLAAIVLALGALQAFQMGGSENAVAVPPVVVAKAPVEKAPVEKVPADKVTEAAREAAPQSPTEKPAAKAPLADPQTTQSIAESTPTRPAPPPVTVPRVASMESLKGDLAAVPPALGTLKQAALDGDGASIFELAVRESDGRGMPRDLALAAKLYEKLANAGYAPAQFKLGSFYEKGSGLVRDLAQAKLWYGRAAEQGNTRSMHNLAVLHAENPAAGGKPDFATASAWFRRAAEYGVRDSQYNLAVLYARGLGVSQDLIQSYAWFSAAASQGDDEAGKKRDDVAGKLSPKDLANAKSVVAAYKPKASDPAVNEAPSAKAVAPAAMSLLGAPPPGSAPPPNFAPNKPAPRTPASGV